MSFKSGIVIATSVLLAIAAFHGIKKNNTQLAEIQNPSVKDIFDQWSNLHGKNYATSEENTYRMRVFLRNWLEVNRINDLKLGYTLGLNQFSDMTPEEFQAKYMGYMPSSEPRNVEILEPEVSLTQQAGVDWRTKGIVNAVKNQGQCGSCWAFSAVAAIEGAMAQSTGKLATFAEQQLVDCSSMYGNHGCNGGLMDNAFKYVMSKGLTTSDNYPYTAKDGSCNSTAVSKKVAHISSYKDVSANNTDALKTAATQRVVSVAIQANAIMQYTGGVFDNPACGTQLNHGVSVVGYGNDSATKKDYWIVRNSWGGSWGEQGYIRMLIQPGMTKGECGINMDPSYPVV